MADLLNIGKTGLLAYQRSLAATSHNITNVNTEGYTRQRVDLSTQPPQFTGAGFEGTGVQVASLKRVYDQFLNSQVTANVSLFRQQESLAQLAGELDNYLADPQVGLSPVLQNFFKSMQDLSTDPSSTPIRQVVLSDAETLTDSFKDSYQRLQSLNNGINIQLTTAVDEINNLSRAIADINEDILFSQGASDSFPPNDLLDQRDALINQLAELVGVSTVGQSDGTVNVFIGSGQSLVVGTTAQTLTLTPNEYDRTRQEIGIVAGTGSVNITSQLTGGKLGGVLTFRRDVLDNAYNSIGQLALVMSEDVNTQHQLGLTLNNTLGGNFFNDITSNNSVGSSFNTVTTDYVFTSTVSDSTLLQASDYSLDYSAAAGGTYTLTRLSDNTVVGSETSIAALSATISATEGFTLSLASGTSISFGDRFLVSPVRNAARDIDLAITNTNDIAAASPLIFSRSAANTGDAAFGADGLVSRTGTTLPPAPITFTYSSATNEFTLSTGGTISYDPTTDSGTQFTVTVAGLGDYQFTVTGTPADGDVFSLGSNAGGRGDNRNLLQLIDLQEQKLIDNSNSNYQEAYSDLVSNIAVQTKRAEFSRDANQTLYERSLSSQQEVSGVNLDEEAANLLKFQQAYQAVARIITTADELFQTVLGAVSR